MTKQYTSDPKGRKFLSTAAFLLTLVIIFALNILRQYVKEKFPQYLPDTASLPEKLIIVLMIVFAAVYVVFIVIFLPMWYKTIRYIMKDNEIISCSGLISKTYRIMKLTAVQHASRISLPFSKYTCFNFISLNALGGSMLLMFLSEKDCREIMDIFEHSIAPKSKQTQTVQQPAPAGKYSLSRSDGSADYVYTDNSSLLSSEEISDVLDGYSSFRQLSFDDMPDRQLTFSDTDSGEDKK